jgi:hypothetical protein
MKTKITIQFVEARRVAVLIQGLSGQKYLGIPRTASGRVAPGSLPRDIHFKSTAIPGAKKRDSSGHNGVLPVSPLRRSREHTAATTLKE